MTSSKRDFDDLLDRTADAIRRDVPDDETCEAAASRTWRKLAPQMAGSAPGRSEAQGGARADAGPGPSPEARRGAGSDAASAASSETIRSCDDVRALLGRYVAGELPKDRALLVEDHTRECLPCRRALIAAREGRSTPTERPGGWSLPAARASATPPPARTAGARWMLAAAAVVVAVLGGAALVVTGVIGGGAYARVASIEGDLFALGSGGQALSAGDEIARGQAVRTGKGSGAVLTLTDGSRVELRERSELAVFGRGTNTTVDLERGAVIVEAAKRSRGNLFVDTEDCRVAVTGTIFSVNHGTKGSRVSVIEGEVRVERGRAENLLQPGQQVTTRASLTPIPLAEEIAWSRDLDRYLALMAELNVLHEEIRRAVQAPLPRTSTHLLDLAPEGTLIYAALPNVSESLGEARRVFRERLDESPVLRELLAEAGSLEHQEELDRLAERIRDYGSFLGEEVALTLSGEPDVDEPTAVGYARVLEPEAFRTFVEQEVAVFGSRATIHLVSGPEEAAEIGGGDGIYVWPTGDHVVLATAPEGIAAMARSLEGSAATFQGSELHAALTETYLEGVEWLLAVDLQTLLQRSDEAPEDLLGFEGARHLVARWSEADERPSARAVLSFDGPRRGVASWLAAPAPMGSLEYVTGDAAAATAFVVRDPEEMVDELLVMLLDRDPEALEELERIQREEGFDLRADLAAPLGGEIAVALDGPLAPKPSFKVVVEVYDPVRLQQTLEWAVARLAQEARAEDDASSGDATDGGEFALTSEDVGGRTFYRLATPAGGVAVHYTYDDSYLVAAPSRGLLEKALTARETGANLPAAERFRRLLPADGYANFSAVVFQDLGSHLAPLTRTLARARSGEESGEAAEPRELTPEETQTLEKAAERHPPTLGYAYGEEDRIVFAATLGEGSLLSNALFGIGGAANGLGGLETLLAEASAEGSTGP